MLSFLGFCVLTLVALTYIAAGFALRIGWSQMTNDERMLWKVAFFPHALLLGDLKMPKGQPSTAIILFGIFVVSVAMTCLERDPGSEFGDQVFRTFVGIWLLGFLLIATNAMVQDWFK